MSRRTKRSEEIDRGTAQKARGSHALPFAANPPKPSKPLLAMAIALLAAWLGFLLVMALTGGKWF